MTPLQSFGKPLLLVGVILILLGILLTYGPSLPAFPSRLLGWVGRLPGDIRIEGARGTFYFPIVSCLVISAVLSLIFWLIGR